MLHEVLLFLKANNYDQDQVMTWFNGQIKKVFLEENTISKGIPLQVCDVFLQELNKVDADSISYKDLAQLLSPFLYALGNCRNKTLTQRILEKVFNPLLDNNVTPGD
jgi:Nucleolar protein,Nop52